MNIFKQFRPLLLGLSFLVLSACGGGTSSDTYQTPFFGYFSYFTVDDLPEGVYVTYKHPYTNINSMRLTEVGNCVEIFSGDCDVFNGSPEYLPSYDKYYVASTGQTYYLISDLSDNPYSEEEYEYDMEVVSYDFPDEPSTILNNYWHFSEASTLDKRIWVIEVDGISREFYVRNSTLDTYDYALIRFTDYFAYTRFVAGTYTKAEVESNLQEYFEPSFYYYVAHSWSELYSTDFEVLDVFTISGFDTQIVEAVPGGLTCVVPLLDGYLNAETGLSGCQYNTDDGVDYTVQQPRYYDLDITYLMGFVY